jgi:hypothetical protein
MQDTKLSQPMTQIHGNKILWIVFLAIVGLGLGLYASNAVKALRGAPPAPAAAPITHISQADLEAQYGLHVNLVAVTAAGGLVDLRFKIVDGEKARSLLQQPENFPTLQVAGSSVTLSAPEEGRPAEITFEDDANLFLMYPNAAGAVKSGTPVIIRFGDIQVESIPAK